MEGTGMIRASGPQESRKLWQYLAATSACMLAVAVGTALAWTSPVLPQLYQTDSFLYVTKGEGSWIGSSCAIGAIAGALIAGPMADKLGRKKSLLLLAAPFLISWGIIVVAKNVWLLYIARLIVGSGVGAACVLVPTYISEIAETSTRGALGTFFQLFLTIGILVTFILGSILSYTLFAIVCALVVVLFLVTFVWMPESPIWLVTEKKKNEAKLALTVLRGDEYDPGEELENMQKGVDDNTGNKSSISDMIKNPALRRALIASFGGMAFQQLSGINAVIFYTVTIFEAAGSSIPSDLASILVAGVQVVMSLVATFIVDRAGRKPLLMGSSSVISLSLIAIGYYFNLKDGGKDVSSLGSLPLISLVVFMIAFSIGLGPIPWMLMGELFTPETKAVASGLAVMLNWLLVFLVTKTFPSLKDGFGSDVTFWIFAGIMAFATIFTYFFIPETKGKSFDEIQADLQRGSR